MHTSWVRGSSLVFALVAVAALWGTRSEPARGAVVTAPQQSQTGDAARQRALQTPQRFRAFAANLTGGRPAAQTVVIEIKHWSADAQRDQLLQVLRDKGEKAMLGVLQKMPAVGTIRTPDTLAYDLHFARSQPWGDGGEQILIATDRYINYWEAVNAARSMDYPFRVIQMRIKANGEGEGRVSVATKVTAAGREIVLENYESQPVLLTKVTREK